MMLSMKPQRLYPLALLFGVFLVALRLMLMTVPPWAPAAPQSVAGAWVEPSGDVWVAQETGGLVISGEGAPFVGSWRQQGDTLRLSLARESGEPQVSEVRPVFSDGGATMRLTWQGRERRLTRVEER